MKKISLVLALFIFSSCVGLGGYDSLLKTKQLQVGMSTVEVQQILGTKPYKTKIVLDGLYWKYQLHLTDYGWVPFYLMFNKNNETLVDWYVGEDEYRKNQEMWNGIFSAANAGPQPKSQNPQNNQPAYYAPTYNPYVPKKNKVAGNNAYSYPQTAYAPTSQTAEVTQAEAEEMVRKQWRANLGPGQMADMDYNTGSAFRQQVDELTGKKK